MAFTSLKCIETECASTFDTGSKLYTCPRCGGLLEVVYDLESLSGTDLKLLWDQRRGSTLRLDQSGVWRFRELLPDSEDHEIVTMIEGQTQILEAPVSADYAGLSRLAFKHLGFNPTGSFKDLGMTTGITQARRLEATRVACASTGNTSASLAAYAARAGMRAYTFVPSGQIAAGKLAQALDYGATVLQIDGDFDVAMRLVREIADETDLYLLNSVNPFRLEGQKTVAFELMQQRGWRAPDRIVVPGGNLGNSSAIAKGFSELKALGLLNKTPRLTVVQAHGANPLYRMWHAGSERLEPLAGAQTLASAIRIGSPVSWKKAQRALKWMAGTVEEVSEQEIADAKAVIGRDGIGCEPASAATLAGLKKMVKAGLIDKDEDILAILTGHLLKDPDYTFKYHQGSLGDDPPITPRFVSRIVKVAADRSAVLSALGD
jgi:threonine synthase